MKTDFQHWKGCQFYANLPESVFCSFREAGYAAELAKRLDRCYPELYEEYDVLWYFQLVHDHATWDIRGFKKPLVLFIVGHECPQLPESVIQHAAFVFKQYLDVGQNQTAQHVFRIPVGPSSVFPNLSPVPFSERKWNVFFAGNLHHGRRRLYEELTGVRFLPFSVLHRSRRWLGTDFSRFFPSSIVNFSKQFHSGFATEEYAALLADSKIVLCPYGVSEQETMRHFEALKQGCVVVTDRMPDTFYFREAPLVVIPDWKNIRKELKNLLSQPSFIEQKAMESFQWWKSVCSVDAVCHYIYKNITLYKY